jgi:hypothetical protein
MRRRRQILERKFLEREAVAFTKFQT